MKKHLSVKALLMGIVLTILKILNDYPLYNWKRIIGFAFFSILIFNIYYKFKEKPNKENQNNKNKGMFQQISKND